MISLQPVLIRWNDAAVVAGWEELSLVLAKEWDPTVSSVGFIIQDEEEFVTLALSYSTDPEQVNGTVSIPRVLIIEIIPLVPQETPPE